MVSMATYIYTNLHTHTRTHTHIYISASRSVCAIRTTIAVRICMHAAPRSFRENSAHRVPNTVSYGGKEIAAYENLLDNDKIADRFEISTKISHCQASTYVRTNAGPFSFSSGNLAVNFYYASFIRIQTIISHVYIACKLIRLK